MHDKRVLALEAKITESNEIIMYVKHETDEG